MRWVVRSMISILSWLLLRVTWWTLRGVRACNHELRAQSVATLSNGAYTIVFWPGRQAILSLPPDKVRMSTAWLLTWWFPRWKRWRTLVTRGASGAADGTPAMPSTSNYQAPPNGRERK